MPSITLSYPCYEPSKRPRPLTAVAIWQLAHTAREQLFGRVVVGTILADELIRRCRSFRVNGVLFSAVWDRDAALADDEGRPALGLCDYDEAAPEQIMISLNGLLLEEQPEVAATTAVHEIGHAVFDLPADVQATRNGIGRGSIPPVRALPGLTGQSPTTRGAMDWAEFRANEFMGGFMAPPRLLHKRLLAYAGEARLPLIESAEHHGVKSLPVPRYMPSEISDLLAEEFGVSPTFIEVRLAKYRLVINP